jgi:predicted aspartyl protease
MVVTISHRKRASGITRVVQVDTGFSESIAIDDELIDSLRPNKVGEVRIATATSMDVRVELYLVYLTIPEVEIRDEPFAALRATRCLIGRKIMDGRKWLLNNVKNELCLLKPS